jgi:hypothetical protein
MDRMREKAAEKNMKMLNKTAISGAQFESNEVFNKNPSTNLL